MTRCVFLCLEVMITALAHGSEFISLYMFLASVIGVDSMVIAKILSVLYPGQSSSGGDCNSQDKSTILGIHIDYANRSESATEAAFVQSWSEQHGIVNYVRRIDEVTRGITGRDDYERIARDLRYGYYKEIIGQYSTNSTRSCSRVKPLKAIMFGHHVGDVQENVVSNIMRYCWYTIYMNLYFLPRIPYSMCVVVCGTFS